MPIEEGHNVAQVTLEARVILEGLEFHGAGRLCVWVNLIQAHVLGEEQLDLEVVVRQHVNDRTPLMRRRNDASLLQLFPFIDVDAVTATIVSLDEMVLLPAGDSAEAFHSPNIANRVL